MCTRFGVDRSQRVKHGALLDAQLLAQVYVELTGGRQIGLGLVADAGPADAGRWSGTARPSARSARRVRTTPATRRKLSATARFIAEMASPLVASLRRIAGRAA